jgi:hypothetical protein
MLQKIISGGQTGVDRAALDVAIELGLSHGGWCPKGRKAEDGVIPKRYCLIETPTGAYRERTAWNVWTADATLILFFTPLSGGTKFTRDVAQLIQKPFLLVALNDAPEPRIVSDWLRREQVHVLNVAGNRASQHRQAYRLAKKFLREVLGLSAK